MRFEWDIRKNRSNRVRHRVGFETAEEVFNDPFPVSGIDDLSGTEERWLSLRTVFGNALFFVVHTAQELDGEVIIRIITVGKATPHEGTRYERETTLNHRGGPDPRRGDEG